MFVPRRIGRPAEASSSEIAEIVNDGPPSLASTASALVAERAAIRVRSVTSLHDFHACVDLQAEVWGPEYTDSVPASLLQVATYVGGIVLGAFTSTGELAGFLFGLTGVQDGEIVHWSHVLGVRDTARNLGVGRMLKEAQRAELAQHGIRRMSWTFDPLVAKNAHLNLNRLGARVVEYVPNMYGTTTSPLHYGLATDRLVVSWNTDAPPPVERHMMAQSSAPVLSLALRHDDVTMKDGELPSSLLIEIPTDILQVIERSPDEASAWRQAVRGHFLRALGLGYEVTGLHREPVTSRSFYVLERRVG
jgi:predicted GNAT superfamily acetyltransferase